MLPSDRPAMYRFLEERMTRTYSELSERQQLEPDTSLVKTYIIEAHPNSENPDKYLKYLPELITTRRMETNFNVKLHERDDPSFFILDGNFRNKEKVIIFVDMTDTRYWLLHTVASSNSVDWIINNLVNQGPNLDRTWFPIQLLNSISTLGSLRGLSLDFDRRKFKNDNRRELSSIEYLKMQLWGNRSRKVLEVLQAENAFPESTTLSKIKLKYYPDDNNDDDFTIDDIKYDGKITARGTSVESHIAIIDHLIKKYSFEIKKIEELYSFSTEKINDIISIKGESLTILLNPHIADLDSFCDYIFSCSEPFRLWGVPTKINAYLYRIRAFDLHVGSTINFEISPEFIRIFLPRGSCGNTVMRFFTNLQHSYNSLVKIVGVGGEELFEF